MKKFLTILAVAGAFAACNSGENKEEKKDSVKTDSVTTAPAPTMDTTKHDSAVKVAPVADTAKKAK